MDFKGTKGDWRVERDDNEIYIIADSPIPPHHGNIVCVMDNDNTNIETDSRLIASAPDLLKSLQKLVEMMKSPCVLSEEGFLKELDETIKEAEEVIKKALENG